MIAAVPPTDSQGASARFGPGLADLTDEQYLAELVRQVADELGVVAVAVCEVVGRNREVGRIVALFLRGHDQPSFRYTLAHSPCGEVSRGHPSVIPTGVAARYAAEPFYAQHGIEAYVGVPLFDQQGLPIGVLSVMDDEPIEAPDRIVELLRRLQRRAGAELERSVRHEVLRERTRRLMHQNEVLRQLARSPDLAAGELGAFASEVTAVASKTLDVERANTWVCSEDQRALRCIAARAGGRTIQPDGPLSIDDCPDYFAAIDSGRVVATVDSCTDPRTRSLAERYLRPLGIASMLEAPIRSGGRFRGILCCEHVGEPRVWFDDEETFVASLADLLSLAFESADRRRAERLMTVRAHELSVLQRISELTIAAGTTAEGLQAVLAEIRRTTGFPSASVQLFQDDGDDLLVESGTNEEVRCGGYGLPRPATESGSWTVEHVDDELVNRFPQLGDLGIVRFVSIPLISQKTELGTLFLSDTRPGPIDAEVVRFADGLGQALAAFLERQKARGDEERLKVQLLQSRKLEAIGTLAAGVAHDFNNLLTGILGYAWRLKQLATPDDPVDQATTAIENAAERASELTHRLLGFARRGPGQSVTVELTDVVREAAGLLDRTLDENVRVEVDSDGRRSTIRADPGQIHLMLLNMAVNARDAMPTGGTLTFAVRSPDPGEDEARWVELDVLDTGTGIPEDRLDRVFEPFYTSKEVGQGTGMGLAMVYGIVQSHSGRIRVENRPGGGAGFHIRFPALGAGTAVAPEERPVFGRGRILVVDDESFARDAASELLTSLGYTVTTAENGVEAIRTFEEARGEIDLVVLDIVMPRMGGRECLRSLKRLDPAVRVVLASDWSLEGIGHLGLNQDALGLVEKPFQLVQLSQIVASVLEAPRDEPLLPS